LQLGRRLDQRRSLLGRVADTRPLGGELCRDQEPEAEQRGHTRDSPARDSPQTSSLRRHRAGLRYRDQTSTPMPPAIASAATTSPGEVVAPLPGSSTCAADVAAGPRVARTAGVPDAAGAGPPSQPDGTGPGAAGFGLNVTGALAPRAGSPAAVNAGGFHPIAR